jgi:hypothetical protein
MEQHVAAMVTSNITKRSPMAGFPRSRTLFFAQAVAHPKVAIVQVDHVNNTRITVLRLIFQPQTLIENKKKMKNGIITIIIILSLISCERGSNTYQLSTSFPDSHNTKPQTSFELASKDEVSSISLINNLFCVEKLNERPIYDFYDYKGKLQGSFGIIGHGSGEFLLPHLFEGEKDSLMVIDDGLHKLFSVYNYKIYNPNNFYVNCAVNDVKTIRWPYIGFYHFGRGKIVWDIYNLSEKEVEESIEFQGEEPYLETFKWSSSNNYLVFAYQYYKKIKICKLTSDMKIQEEKVYQTKTAKPHGSKSYFTDIVCGKDYFLTLSQEDIVIEENSLKGTTKLQKYDYHGLPLKELILDGIYLRMALDEKENKLYLVPIDDSVIKYIQLNQ